MKILIPNNTHGLSHALAREAVSRHDVDTLVVPSLAEALTALDTTRVDAVVIPPLLSTDKASLVSIEDHVRVVETLLASCQRDGLMLLWCMSDQVFDQDHEGSWGEDDIPEPMAAGLQNLVALDRHITEHWARHVIMRVGPLFGHEGAGLWLPDMLSRWTEGQTTLADDDLFVGPASVDYLARAITGMLLQLDNGTNGWGRFHFSGSEPVTLYEFASIAHAQLEDALVHRGLAHRVPRGTVHACPHPGGAIRRILNGRKILDTFGVHQHRWRDVLKQEVSTWVDANFREQAPESSIG